MAERTRALPIRRLRMKDGARAYGPADAGGLVQELHNDLFRFEEGELGGARGVNAHSLKPTAAAHPTFIPWTSIASVWVLERGRAEATTLEPETRPAP